MHTHVILLMRTTHVAFKLLQKMNKTHFEAVTHRRDGCFAVCSSTLTGREWDGNLWVFRSLQELKDCPNLYLVNTRTQSGISDIVWLSDQHSLLAACDSGELEIWNCRPPGNMLERRGSLKSHDDMVLCLCRLGGVAVWGDKVASGGADGRVIVWDVASSKSLRNYKGHTHSVLSVASNGESSDTFITTSQDGSVRLWDLRLQNPAKNITACCQGPYSSVAWNKDVLAVGSERGVVEALDLRADDFFLFAHHPIHARSIHKMTFAPWDSSLLASVSDDTLVHVHSILSNKVVFEYKGHRDFVRGVSWHPNTERRGLLTCGWDGLVLEHNVPHPPQGDVQNPPVEAAVVKMETGSHVSEHGTENGYVTPS